LSQAGYRLGSERGSPNHGSTPASKRVMAQIPTMGFPFIVFAVWRAIAKRRPFRCPDCGAAIAAE
jgi:hypothetical protein